MNRSPLRAVRLSLAISLALHAAVLVQVGAPPALTAAIRPLRPVVAVLSLSLVGAAEPAQPSRPVLATRVSVSAPVGAPAAPESDAEIPPQSEPQPPSVATTAAATPPALTEALADSKPLPQPLPSDIPGPSTHPLWRSTDSAALAAQTGAALSAQAQSAQYELARRQAEPGQRAAYETGLRTRLLPNPLSGDCQVDIADALSATALCGDAADREWLQTLLAAIGPPPFHGHWQIELAGASVAIR